MPHQKKTTVVIKSAQVVLVCDIEFLAYFQSKFFDVHLLRVVHPKFFVKLDFETAVDQNSGTHDRAFEEVPNSQCKILCAGGHAQKISNSPYNVKTKQMGALVVATDVLSTRTSLFLKLDKRWLSYEPKRCVHL